ncbi:MAG: diacylglycerol kinase family lipid kinase [Gammaproteobacteria bacterium]|nr:diacylglycerol kinase family lipid kinase [Gammaproteobacteria bacterium]
MGISIQKPKRISVIFNPTAGGRRHQRLQAVIALLQGSGSEVMLQPTGRPGDAESFARDAKDVDVIVAAGGDGTINEVANGLLGRDIPLALLPMGTANVIAAEIGLGVAPQQIAETILWGAIQKISLGRIDGRVFIAMVGVGYDARVVAGVHLGLKRWLGKGAYGVEAIRQLIQGDDHLLNVTVDGVDYHAASVVVANGRYYAGRYILDAAARITDPLLHVCLFERSGRWNLVRYSAALFSDRIASLADFRIVTGSRVTITGAVGEPVQGDGDVLTQLPVEIESIPGAIELVMPIY